MFVIQYAFVTLKKAQSIAGFPGIVSCYQVRLKSGISAQEVIDGIEAGLSDVAVYDRKTFLMNNTREMESGFLPLLYVVAFIGAVVLMTILSLILSINVLERRKDFAIMKALGAPKGFIPGLVIQQGLILAGSGMILAVVSFFPLVSVVEGLSPEVSAESSLIQIITVALGVVVISLISSIIPNRRLRNVYPLEVF
jgi:putative ABC transport system permease protein